MDKIFVGFLFCYLNFNLNINAVSINLLPEFVGYLLLYLGAKELVNESERYTKVQPLLMGLTVYHAIVWLMALIGRTGSIVALLLNLIAAVVGIYATYQVVMGFQDIERAHSVDIAAEKSIFSWKVCAGINVAAILLAWIPVLNILLLLGMVVAVIFLLVSIHHTRKLYNAFGLLRPESRDVNGPEF